ncbi:Uncharacterized conserved protein [Bordetella pertussis]|uniref:DUF488 domain-containing protein n=1 Tax=Bordetella pertussis TaxID=520 RepID=UPI0005E0FF35|nr:DUF488 family protein [Bordetella pertussis]CFN29881.1 Uncharacterized conserved protein [Bordetella pertussis]
MKPAIHLKRAYEAAAPADGRRVLIDGLWPRGLRKDALPLDDWIKDLAPSAARRQWFGHQTPRWPAFRERYLAELRGPSHQAQLRCCARRCWRWRRADAARRGLVVKIQ